MIAFSVAVFVFIGILVFSKKPEESGNRVARSADEKEPAQMRGQLVRATEVPLDAPKAEDFRLTIPTKHSSPVKQVVFSLDGLWMASLGSENDIKVWDVQKKELLADIIYPGQVGVTCLIFRPSPVGGASLIAGLDNGEVLLIDKHWQPTSRLQVMHGSAIRQFQMAGDQKSVIILGDYVAKVLEHYDNYVLPLASISINDDGLSFSSDDSNPPKDMRFRLRSWATVNVGNQLALGMAMSDYYPNRDPVAKHPKYEPRPGLAMYKLNVQKSQVGEKIKFLESWPLQDYLANPQGLYYIGNDGIRANVKDDIDRKNIRSVLGLSYRVDGACLASAQDDGFVRIWSSRSPLSVSATREATPQALAGRKKLSGPACAVSFSPDGKRLAAVASQAKKFVLHVLRGGVTPPRLERQPSSYTIEPTAEPDLFLQSVAIGTIEEEFSIPVPGTLVRGMQGAKVDVEWISEGRNLLFWSQSTGQLCLVDIKTKRVTDSIGDDTFRVTAKAVNRTLPYFAIGSEDGSVFLVKQGSYFELLALVPEQGPGWTDMSKDGNWPPVWIENVDRKLDYRTALSGVPLLHGARGDWSTYMPSGDHLWTVTNAGFVYGSSLRPPYKVKEFKSPLGKFDRSVAPIIWNRLEYNLDRLYGTDRHSRSSSTDHIHHHVWTWQYRRQERGNGFNILPCPSANTLALAGGATTTLFALDMSNGKTKKLLTYTKGSLCRMNYAEDGKVLVAWWIEDLRPAIQSSPGWDLVSTGFLAEKDKVSTKIVTFDLVNRKKLAQWTVPSLCSDLAISRDGSTVAIVTSATGGFFSARNGRIYQYVSLEANVRLPYLRGPWEEVPADFKEVNPMPWPFPFVALSPRGDHAYFFDETGKVMWLGRNDTAKGGNRIVTRGEGSDPIEELFLRRTPENTARVVMSPSGRWIAFPGRARGLKLYNTEDGKGYFLRGHHGSAYPMCFSPDERLLITEDDLHLYKVWDVASKQNAMDVFIYGPDAWVARRPDGLWDGTKMGLARVRLVSGTWRGSFLGAGGLQRVGLVDDVLLGKPISPPTGGLDWQAAGKSPTIKVKAVAKPTNSKVDLSVHIQGRGGATKVLKVFVDGDLVREERGSIAGSTEAKELAVKGVPVPSGLSSLQVVALGDGGFRSESNQVRIVAPRVRKSILHAICIGVNTEGLETAASDAKMVAEALANNKAVYGGVRIHPLYKSPPTKAQIELAMEIIAEEAQPDDAFVFYYAGHGSYTNDGRAILRPLGAGTSMTDSAAINSVDIMRWMTNIRAHRKLWILDACGTGNLSVNLNGLGKAMRGLVVESQSAIFAAIRKIRVQEVDDHGGGKLTRAFLAALHGGQSTVYRIGETIKIHMGDQGQPPNIIHSDLSHEFRLGVP